jgi:hypothetical protein
MREMYPVNRHFRNNGCGREHHIAVPQPLPIFLPDETLLARRRRDSGRRLHLIAGAELVREAYSGQPDSRP